MSDTPTERTSPQEAAYLIVLFQALHRLTESALDELGEDLIQAANDLRMLAPGHPGFEDLGERVERIALLVGYRTDSEDDFAPQGVQTFRCFKCGTRGIQWRATCPVCKTAQRLLPDFGL